MDVTISSRCAHHAWITGRGNALRSRSSSREARYRMRHRLMSLAGLVVVMACTTPARAELSPFPDETWTLDGSRVQDVIAAEGAVFVGGRFSAAVSPDGTVSVPAG